MGYMGRTPIGGVIWQHLHYIVGLQRLGHDVYYVEDSKSNLFNPISLETSRDYRFAVRTLKALGNCYGFPWAYCPRFLDPPQSFGLALASIRRLYREADAILNVCGIQEINEDLLKSGHLIYVETDPGIEQIKLHRGDKVTKEKIRHHRVLFTFGENVPDSNTFPVPLNGYDYHPTRQPVVIDFWKECPSPSVDAMFTTIANWSTRGLKDISWNGQTFLWSKAENFIKFVDMPRTVGQLFEIATDIKDKVTADLFRKKGWHLTDPYGLSADLNLYQRYIQGSRGEFTVSKEQFVRLNTGWFSDRSACYLAAGRPVITQETGFTRFYGGDKGLFSFSNVEEIKEAESAIRADYRAHSRAAYEIACEFFEAGKVLRFLLDRAEV
jgi:hypothetical protein